MPHVYVTSGRVLGGHLQIRNRRHFEDAFKRWRDCEVTVTIEKKHATRNLEQNALYFAGYVKPLADEFGWTVNDMHEYLKKRFLPQHKRLVRVLALINKRTGELLDEIELDASTTTTLNKVEFSEYLRDIQVWGAGLGMNLGSNREAA